MVFPILGANTESAAYEIENSLRFNDGDSPKLQITTGSNSARDRFTFSAWVKKAQDTGDDQTLFSANDGGHQPHIRFDNTSEQLNVRISNSASYNVKTNRSFRDPSAWYHIVVAMNTQESTASNRIKIYVNGVQETSLATADYPTQNYNSAFNSNTELTLGRDISNDDNPFDGYMAEVYYVDGIQYAASDFGEYNNNGVWVPKDAKDDINFGTHGFYFEFKQTGTSANSSGIGADTSGNDNHYTPTNLEAIDVTVDTPTNNFCTWNSLANYYAGSTFSEGNCYITMANSVSTFNTGTFGLTSGKWYWETKVINIGSGSDNFLVGAVSREDSRGATDYLGEPTSVVYRNNGQIKKDSGNATHGASFGVNDIAMVALDLDNNNIYFGSNGNWADGSGNNDESSPTSAVSLTNTMITEGTIFPAQGDLHGNTPNPIASTNFGNPPHSISSGNSDANGYGNFEYAVPSGYYALCTKNLAEYG